MIFSNVLAMFEITDIGRKFSRVEMGPILCMEVIIATLKKSGILFCDIHKLKILLNGLQNVKQYFFSKSKDILSRPGEDSFFKFIMASKISL
jgi:hypothetical protein